MSGNGPDARQFTSSSKPRPDQPPVAQPSPDQLERAQAAYSAAFAGETFDFPIDGLDHLGVSVATVCGWVDGAFCDGVGYGPTPAISRLSAWGELIEAVLPKRTLPTLERRRGSYRELQAQGVPAIDPLRLRLPVGTPYTPDMQLQWVEARRHPDGDPVWVPIEFAAQAPDDLEPGDLLITPITNGMGAGDTLTRAITHGLLELLQRDGNSVGYRALDRGVGLELDEIRDPDLRELLERYDRAGVEVIAKLAATDFGLANVYVVGFDRDLGAAPHALTLSACGEAVHPDREVALSKALLEFASSRSRKAFTHGSIELIAPVMPPGYLERYRASYAGSGEARAFRSMLDLAARDRAGILEQIEPTLRVRERIPFSSLPTTDIGSDPAAVLALLTERLAAGGLDIYYLDLTPPGSKAHAAHVIVPALEVETMTYRRIGPRNLKRLLERGVDFVGLGTPPDGSQRIPMTEADEAGCGGPAWFHAGRADATVGELYALYREPPRHAVAFEGG